MFNLVKADTFRDCDIILTVKPDMEPTKLQTVLEELSKIGMNVYAYSNREDHKQYMLVPDIEKLREQHQESCRNSLAMVLDASPRTFPIP